MICVLLVKRKAGRSVFYQQKASFILDVFDVYSANFSDHVTPGRFVVCWCDINLCLCLFCHCLPSQNIMRDKWMNIGFEDDELKPFKEPPADVLDPIRIGNDRRPHPRIPASHCLCVPSHLVPLCVVAGGESHLPLYLASNILWNLVRKKYMEKKNCCSG